MTIEKQFARVARREWPLFSYFPGHAPWRLWTLWLPAGDRRRFA